MKLIKILLTLSLAWILLLGMAPQAMSHEVNGVWAHNLNIPDPNLREAMRAQIEKDSGQDVGWNINAEDTGFLNGYFANAGIRTLTGLEHCSHLVHLELNDNTISDISVLAELPLIQLPDLTLTPLLAQLDLSGNTISDISALAELPSLKYLFLSGNSISDISALAGLTQLKSLRLYDNTISDISALAGLTQLVELHLSGNSVSDISALAGLTQMNTLGLISNSISDISALAGLTQLETLYLTDNSVSDISALAGLTQLYQLYLDINAISDIPDLAGLTRLKRLDLSDNSISDISNLAGLTQLEWLDLSDNTISDISALAGLTQLKWLMLNRNSICDLSALDISILAGLPNLKYLALGGNSICDISNLAGLTQLESLYLSDNSVSDLSALAGLTQLESLYLSDNAISDLSALAELMQLKQLNLTDNAISDVSPLLGLTQLTGEEWDRTGLHLRVNPLSYTSIHEHIPAIQAEGIEVAFDNRAHAALLKISGDGQRALIDTQLATPFVVKAMDEHGEPMKDVIVTFTLIPNDLTVTTCLYDLTDVLPDDTTLRRTTARTNAEGMTPNISLRLGPTLGKHVITATATQIQSPVTWTAIAFGGAAGPQISDVNSDDEVTIQDLVLVAAHLGNFDDADANGDETDADVTDDSCPWSVSTPLSLNGDEIDADVNRDGIVNITDLVLVAAALRNAAGAPAVGSYAAEARESLLIRGTPTRAEVQQWLTEAKQVDTPGDAYQRGIGVLEQLFVALTPRETRLLHNYPNPFNPETWLPYQLATDADVRFHIYAVDGTLVRTLAVGHQLEGVYQRKGRAAYWDGRNEIGERVASGLYFYTLTADDFTATNKMLIRK